MVVVLGFGMPRFSSGTEREVHMTLEHRLGLALALFLIPLKILNESSLAEGVSVAVLDSWPEM